MPTKAGPNTLSARLRSAQGRPAEQVREEVIVVSDIPGRAASEPKDLGGTQTRCTSSVMAGQRCGRPAVVGGTLCGNHRAMMGAAATR